MLNVLDGVINQNRFDVDVADGVINSGIEGLWVAPASVNGTTKYDFAANAVKAFVVWTESHKDGTPGFTYDAQYLKKVAVLNGHFRAETDQFTGTPTVGAKLKTTAAGKLEVAGGSDNSVAVCLKAPYTKSYLGRSISVIEIEAQA
jgi:hypothetical protein